MAFFGPSGGEKANEWAQLYLAGFDTCVEWIETRALVL